MTPDALGLVRRGGGRDVAERTGDSPGLVSQRRSMVAADTGGLASMQTVTCASRSPRATIASPRVYEVSIADRVISAGMAHAL